MPEIEEGLLYLLKVNLALCVPLNSSHAAIIENLNNLAKNCDGCKHLSVDCWGPYCMEMDCLTRIMWRRYLGLKENMTKEVYDAWKKTFSHVKKTRDSAFKILNDWLEQQEAEVDHS